MMHEDEWANLEDADLVMGNVCLERVQEEGWATTAFDNDVGG
jgi:hypothetical protein